MQRLIIAVLALSGVGVALYIHYEVIYSLFLPFLAAFTRKAALRTALKFLVAVVILPLLPDWCRRWIADKVAWWKRSCKRHIRRTCARWRFGTCWLRMIVVVLGAMFAGLLAFIALFTPFRMQDIPYLGETLQKKALPWLLHRSALGAIERRVPRVAKRVPIFIRRTVGKAYLWLWWNTTVPLWKSRQTLSRWMAKYLENEKAEKLAQKNEQTI